jgi:SAM-dependent methyltransferase
MRDKLKDIEHFYDETASKRDFWKRKNHYYHKELERLYKFLIPKGQKVIEIGCGTGDLLYAVEPSHGTGIDIAEKMILIARKKYPQLKFLKGYAENVKIHEKFDYIILSDTIGTLTDVQESFQELHKISDEHSRIIINYYNYLWEPVLLLGEKFGLKMPHILQNWLSKGDIVNLLELSNLEIVKSGTFLLLPAYIPLVSTIVNKYFARLPLIRNLCLVNYFVARKKPTLYPDMEYSLSLIIPARNEAGNIERALKEIPQLGKRTQIVFVEGNSTDNTKEEIKRIIDKYKNKREVLLVNQGTGTGKGDAVRKGIAKANGDIIVIFDADLTVDPKDLPKFYQAIRTKKGEYIQGSRLVYPMEKEAMRILNIFGNKFFSAAFSFLLDQRIKDTLCGTKAIFRTDYDKIAKNRSYFGDFDPFGDFDLIFGASKLNLKILEIPIRYKARSYGTTNISRFRHGWLLLKMTLFAAKKIKFF